MITRNFNLYLNAGHSVPLVINVNQYDQGEQWVFTLYNADGTQYTPSTGAIVGIKSDGLGIINSGSVVDGKVVINETQQMTASPGKAVFELMIDNQTHGTANFVVLVEEKPGNNADLSDSDLSLIQEALDAVNPLPTGGSVGQVLTKTASGSAWSDAGTPTQAQVAEAVSDWADENITVSTGVVIDTSLSVAGAAADAKKTGDEIADLKSALQGGSTNLPYVVTGSGYIYDYSESLITLNYTEGGTANHKLMVINDLSAAGISVGTQMSCTVGFATGIKYAVGFSTTPISNGSNTLASAIEFPSEDTVQTVSFTVPQGTVAMVIYNRINSLAEPTITIYNGIGLIDKVDANTEAISTLNGEVEQNTSDIEDLKNGTGVIKYLTCAKKPFDFTNKKLWFFGDSITYGYIATPSVHQATNQYPKVFSEAVGADSYVNWGVSGSTLADNYITISTHPLNCDFVFVAGGVNDWQTGVNESTLITTMTNICEHLKNNFSGEVVFITPIYEAGRVPISTPTQTLQNVRNVITRIALEYGYSVVQGWEFPFPTEDDDTDYIDLMFQDKIHPTELGYSMYAQALRSALC